MARISCVTEEAAKGADRAKYFEGKCGLDFSVYVHGGRGGAHMVQFFSRIAWPRSAPHPLPPHKVFDHSTKLPTYTYRYFFHLNRISRLFSHWELTIPQ